MVKDESNIIAVHFATLSDGTFAESKGELIDEIDEFDAFTISNKYYTASLEFTSFSTSAPQEVLFEGLLYFSRSRLADNVLVDNVVDFLKATKTQPSTLFILAADFRGDIGSVIAVQADLCDLVEDIVLVDLSKLDWGLDLRQTLECHAGWRYTGPPALGLRGDSMRGFSEKLLVDEAVDRGQDDEGDTEEGRGADHVAAIDESFQLIAQIRDMMATSRHKESNNPDTTDTADHSAWKKRVEMADKMAKAFGLFEDEDPVV